MENKKEYVYFLIFCTGTLWWTRWLKKGYGHILIGAYGENHLILFERTFSNTRISIKEVKNDRHLIQELFKMGGFHRLEVVTGEIKDLKRHTGIYFNLGSCLSWVKLVLNIRGWYWTPYQLFKLLKKQGRLTTLYKGESTWAE
ncbi:MAG: hypothetical protein KAI17_03280 [Thiotrichaceae bacterium]|nr:hypothetical protein [Thiotrichaceae bacterium]